MKKFDDFASALLEKPAVISIAMTAGFYILVAVAVYLNSESEVDFLYVLTASGKTVLPFISAAAIASLFFVEWNYVFSLAMGIFSAMLSAALILYAIFALVSAGSFAGLLFTGIAAVLIIFLSPWRWIRF